MPRSFLNKVALNLQNCQVSKIHLLDASQINALRGSQFSFSDIK
jgi:hypothetical protein